jgi:hypothetical protein
MKWCILILLPVLAIAQEIEFELEPEAFPVEIEGWQVHCPWAGGYGETAPELADIDSDGDLDFFLGEYVGVPVPFIRNIGDEFNPIFQWEGALSDSFRAFNDEYRTSPELYDLDNDLDLDALIGCGYVTYIENRGTSTEPDFNSAREQLFDTTGNWVFGTHVALVDIDADGDGDLIGGEYQGHLQFYRNIGTPDSFSFYLEDDDWLEIGIGDEADPVFCDIDNDNDYDLFIGERFGKIWYYHNIGDSLNYSFEYDTNYYAGIEVGYFSSPEFADIDGDGDYDLFVGREPTGNYYKGDVYFYENIGSPYTPQFELTTTNYLTMDMGPYAKNPQIVDINGDELPDLIVSAGNILTYFENVGDPQNPSFLFIEEEFQGIDIPGLKPCMVDIDADGDLDLFAGMSMIPGPPTVALFLNQGTPEVPDLVLEDFSYISNPNFMANTNPGLADIDADGDYDLFINEDDGNFYFYENTGDTVRPTFSMITSQWIDYPYPAWRPFTFADIDDDLDLDLFLVSEDQMNLCLYRNLGTPDSAVMVLETQNFLSGYEICYWPGPYFIDMDQDNDLDLFCGDMYGGISFFRNVTGQNEVGPKRPDIPYPKLDFSIGPNPANPVTWISFSLPAPQEATVAVYNILGAKVTTLTSGLYIIRLETSQTTTSQRVMVVVVK